MDTDARKETRNVALLGRYGIDHRRRTGAEISEAHNLPHVRNVAELTQVVGDIYAYSERERFLGYICGWFHDIVRSPSEDPDVKDDEASAHEAVRILEAAGIKGVVATFPEERDAVAFAITSHGRYPEWLSQLDTRNTALESLKNKLWLVLFVADKMEANGVRVIARRSSFVAGDRLRSEKGDLRTFGFVPSRDEGLVVAIESFLRLSLINPEDIYPEKLQPLVHPLYEKQREFVIGIMKALGLTVENIENLLLDTTNAEGKNLLQARKMTAPENSKSLAQILSQKSQITNKDISDASDDLARSAVETVRYFSESYRTDLDQLVATWNPQGEVAKQWQQELVDYSEGNWLK